MDAYRRWAVPVATGSLLVAPVGDVTIALLLGIVLELAVIRVLWRDLNAWRAAAVQLENKSNLVLMRRTLPHLRARRPFGIVEAQVRWRDAAEAHRRRREMPLRAV